jgi:uncharacterized protein
VQEVDVARKRISLTMKIGAAPAGSRSGGAGDNRYQGPARGQQQHGNRQDSGFAGNSAMANAFAKLKR